MVYPISPDEQQSTSPTGRDPDPDRPWWVDTESWLASLEERHRQVDSAGVARHEGVQPRATAHLYSNRGAFLGTIEEQSLVFPNEARRQGIGEDAGKHANESGHRLLAAEIARDFGVPDLILGQREWTGTATRLQISEGFATTIRQALQGVYREAIAAHRASIRLRYRRRKQRRYHTTRS